MEDVEGIRDKATSQSSSASPHRALPSLLLLLARLQMTQIYRRRRERTTTVGAGSKSQSVPVNITKALRQLLFYYRHASLVRQVLSGCMKTFQDCGLFEQKLSLDFAGCLDSPASILQALSVEALSLEGVACLTMGSQKLNLSFSGSSAIVIHLPTRNLPIGNMQDFIIILKRILKAAILQELEANLKKILDGTPNSDAWEVLPTPKAVTKTTTFLARKLADKNKKLKEAEVEAYISILPTVTTVSSDPYQIEIALAATVSTRHSNFASRRTFSSAVDSEPNLLDWLKDKIHHT